MPVMPARARPVSPGAVRGCGALSTRPVSTARTVPAPEAIALSPDGKNAYVTSEHEGALSQFAISPVTGKITPCHRPPSPRRATAHSAWRSPPDAGLAAKVTAPATARHGSALTYTITISDQGPSAAWQLALGGHLPAGTAFRSATAGRGHCTAPHTGACGATVQCHLATLKVGAAWSVHITVIIKASTGTLRDQATVTSVAPGPAPAATPPPRNHYGDLQVDPPPASGPGPGGLRVLQPAAAWSRAMGLMVKTGGRGVLLLPPRPGRLRDAARGTAGTALVLHGPIPGGDDRPRPDLRRRHAHRQLAHC